MKFRIITFILLVMLSIQSVLAAPFQADAKTKRIPAGTKFTLQFLNPISSIGGNADFSAIIMTRLRKLM